jgi:hypothetical protein
MQGAKRPQSFVRLFFIVEYDRHNFVHVRLRLSLGWRFRPRAFDAGKSKRRSTEVPGTETGDAVVVKGLRRWCDASTANVVTQSRHATSGRRDG